MRITYVLCSQGLCEDIGFPGTRVTDGCELPDGCWEPNLDPPEDQYVFLTTAPFLHPLVSFFNRDTSPVESGRIPLWYLNFNILN